ncbi:MAG: hypothetical protein H6896_12055 [Rhodovulum sp.]|nr:hypothetical protein [Rhodovulum sp.]
MTNFEEPRPGRPLSMDAGELAEPIAAYAAHLASFGYAALTIKGCTDSARHLAAWLALSGLTVSALDEHALEGFARHRRRCGGNRASDRLSAKYVSTSTETGPPIGVEKGPFAMAGKCA